MGIPKTIHELEKWLLEINKRQYISINGICSYEGFGIDKWGELYIWFYTERGNRENLSYFRTEEEIVEFAYKEISREYKI